ncbi:MAG: hypothetical protein KJZ54_03580 [Phycisphaerales bacterium]|nr:hypothetical protein [Phycisphaerales bacterium]
MRAAPIIILAATTAAASAQVATWYWTVSDTGNGDGVIGPGESALLSLWVAFDPRQDQPGGGVAAAGPYDTLGEGGWASGTVESRVNHLFFGSGNEAGFLDDENNLREVQHYQYPSSWGYGGPFEDQNPIVLVSLRWTPDFYSFRSITLDNGAPSVVIYVDDAGNHVSYTGAGGIVTFNVVPAPGGAAALLAFGAFTGRRVRGARVSSGRR